MYDELELEEHLEDTARDLVSRFDDEDLWMDEEALVRMGSGALWIELMTGHCRHDGRPVEPLHVAARLSSWLHESLAHGGISRADVADASLTAALRVERYADQRDASVQWSDPPAGFVGMRARIHCRLAVAGIVGEARQEVAAEWADPDAAPA